jgi:hypothetical protein
MCARILDLHDHFKGELFNLQSPPAERGKPDAPTFGSWPKMADSLKKDGAQSYKALLQQKTIHEDIFKDMSNVVHDKNLKGKKPDFEAVKKLWHDTKEHCLSTMLLIDKSRM